MSAQKSTGSCSAPAPTGRVRSAGWWLLYVGLPMLAALLAPALYRGVFHGMPCTTDENSYVFQAYNFLAGCIARPAPVFSGVFFHEMIILDDQVGWLSRYPPGHSLWLMGGCLFGQPIAMVALAAGLSVWLMARTGALFGPRMAWCAAVLLLVSPFFLFTHGTLLSHTSGLLAALLMLYGFLRWQRTDGVRWAALAGLGWCWLYLIRTYTALWMALPFGLYALGQLRTRRHDRRYWLGLALFAGCAAAGGILLLFYNYLALGDAGTMTYLYYNPMEKPGFGLRQNLDGSYWHTWSNGLRLLWNNVSLLDRWLWGGVGSLVAALFLALAGWRRGGTLWLLTVPAMVMVGYIGFYYGGPYDTGPGYYFEALPCLVLAAAAGVARLLDWLAMRPRWLRSSALLLVALALAGNVVFMVRQGRRLHDYTQPLADLHACVAQAPRDALVLVHPDMAYGRRNHGLLVFNPHGLDSQPLVARSVRAADSLLCRLFPGRQPYRLVYTNAQPRLVPYREDFEYDSRFPAEDIPSATGRREPGGERGGIQLVARAGRDAPGWLARGSKFPVYPGRYVMEFELSVQPAAEAARVVALDIVDRRGAAVSAQALTNGASPALAFRIERVDELEPRVYYRGGGDAAFRGFHLRELPSNTR